MTGFEPLAVRQDWNRATEADWAKVLSELPLFSGLGKRQLRKVVRQATFAEFVPGQEVLLTGSPADGFYVILSGTARARGKPSARTLRTGDYFGEIALLDGQPRSATVVATDELHVMKLPRRTFLQLLERHGDAALRIMTELGARVRHLEHLPSAS